MNSDMLWLARSGTLDREMIVGNGHIARVANDEYHAAIFRTIWLVALDEAGRGNLRNCGSWVIYMSGT